MIIERDNKKIEIKTVLEDKENATVFTHFKGKEYKIITIGKDSETEEEKVIYEGQYDNKPVWIRSYKEFFSEVDHNKYKDVKQKYRFEIKE